MNELERIAREDPTGERLLATVVRVEGSSYRRPGARMLVRGDRWLAGCVSGGCLEGDVMMRGVHRSKAGPVVVTYDSTREDGEPYGLGCNGIVDVLLEYIPDGATNDAIEFAASCFAQERVGVLVTVIRSSHLPIGARCSLPEAKFAQPITDARIREAARGPAGVTTIDGTTVLVEHITPSPQLFVLGSGHDAAPIVTLAKAAGFRVTVADRAIREPSRFLAARLAKSDEVPALIANALDAYVVIMHHHEDTDRAALAMALDSHARYIGVLGPAKRTRDILDGRTDARIHAPIGLDVGAETPEQIALSIVGEVQAVHRGARGGMLRDRARALHADIAIAVLAAGEAKRFGRPKQLVELQGTPLVRHVAAICTQLREPVGVVIGAHAAAVEGALGDLRVAHIANPEWSEGIAASIRAAVAWAGSANALVIVLGDQPNITAQHIRQLRDAWLAGAPIVASKYNGIVGAPAIFDRSTWPKLAALTGDQGAGKLLYAEPVAAIDFDGLDIDTEADLTRATSEPSLDLPAR